MELTKMNMKHILVIVLVFFCTAQLAMAQKTNHQVFTLEGCITTAIAANQQLVLAQNQAAIDNTNYQQAKSNLLPYVGANISHGLNEGRSINPYTNAYSDQKIDFAQYNVSASFLLWNGNALQQNIQQNRLNAKASNMDAQQARDNLVIQVILSYLQVLSLQEQIKAAQQQAQVSEAQVQRLTLLNNDGAIAPATLFDMKGQYGNDQLNVINLQNQLTNAKLSLFALMNTNFVENAFFEPIVNEMQKQDSSVTANSAYQLALNNMPMVKAYQYRWESNLKKVKVAKAQLLPSLSFNVGLGTNYSSLANTLQYVNTTEVATGGYVSYNGSKLPVYMQQNNYVNQNISYGQQWKNNFNASLSLVLQIPILNGLQARTKVRQAQIQVKQSAFLLNSTKTQLQQSVYSTYINMLQAEKTEKVSIAQLSDFTQSFHAATVKFEAGVGTSVDYIIAKTNMDKASINAIVARYNVLLLQKVLDYYQGVLKF
jgi:outer membrane protein